MTKYFLIVINVLIHSCFNYHLLSLSISLLIDIPSYYIKPNQWLHPIFRRSLWYLLILLTVSVDWKIKLVWTSILKPQSTEFLSQILMFIYIWLTYLDKKNQIILLRIQNMIAGKYVPYAYKTELHNLFSVVLGVNWSTVISRFINRTWL